MFGKCYRDQMSVYIHVYLLTPNIQVKPKLFDEKSDWNSSSLKTALLESFAKNRNFSSLAGNLFMLSGKIFSAILVILNISQLTLKVLVLIIF